MKIVRLFVVIIALLLMIVIMETFNAWSTYRLPSVIDSVENFDKLERELKRRKATDCVCEISPYGWRCIEISTKRIFKIKL